MGSTFDRLYNASDADLAEAKKPLVKAKVMRGFEAAIDSLIGARLDAEDKVATLRRSIANGKVEDIKALASLRSEIAEIDLQKEAITKERDDMFADK